MSPWLRERTSLGIGTASVACACRDADRLECRALGLQVEGEATDKARRLAEGWAELLEEHRGLPLRRRSPKRVMVADGMARYWMMQAPRGVASLAELRASAEARCAQLLGPGPGWQVAGDWDATRPFLCAAIPGWIHEGARRAFGPGVEIRLALPTALRLARPLVSNDAWVCLTMPGSTSVLSIAKGRLNSVRSVRTQAGLSRDEQLRLAAIELRRERLRTGASGDGTVGWCHLGAQDAVTSSKDCELDGIRFVPMALGQEVQSSTDERVEHADAIASARLGALI